MEVKAQKCHELLKKTLLPKLSYNDDCNYDEYKKQIREKFDELLGINELRKDICPFGEKILSEEDMGDYKRIHFTFNSEPGCTIPCYMLIPNGEKKKYPVVITLSEHDKNGYSGLVGKGKSIEEAIELKKGGDIAVQAVKEGYVAIAMEQRAIGTLCSTEFNRGGHMCSFEAHVAEMLGRTLMGERAWDVSRLITLLVEFNKCDLEKIVVVGEGVGGAAAYYAACLDERITLAVSYGGFGSYKDSIMNYYHCSCEYIPHAYEWFEMQDLACLIAPRKLVVMTGKDDETTTVDGVKKAFHTVEKIYDRTDAVGNCRLVIANSKTKWQKEMVWPAVKEEFIKLGWSE